jgi:Initiator Replication protein.
VAKKLLLVRDGFTRYDYNQAMAFVNKYTVRMYWIINSWRGRQGFRISMSQLRYVMSAEDKYPRDDNFIAKVIKVAYEELREKADIWFEYARDCREGQDMFSFKVYQRLTDQQRERMLRKPKGESLYILSTCWKMPVNDVNEMISKITADNAIEYLRYLRYVTDVTDIRSLDRPASYIKKAMNTFLSTLSPIDNHEACLLP